MLMDGQRRIFLLNRSGVPTFGQSTQLNKNRTLFFRGRDSTIWKA